MKMYKFEKIFLSISSVGFAFNYLEYPGGKTLIVLGLFTMYLIYLFFGLTIFNEIPFLKILKKESYQNISGLRMIGAMLSGFSIATGITGILFKIMHWPGFYHMLWTGFISCLLILVVSIIKNNNNKNQYYSNIIIRVSIIVGVIIIFLI